MLTMTSRALVACRAWASWAGTVMPPACWGPRMPSWMVAPLQARLSTSQSLTAARSAAYASELRRQAWSCRVARGTSGLPSAAAVESPSTTACTRLRAGPDSLATVGSGACPTSPVSEPT